MTTVVTPSATQRFSMELPGARAQGLVETFRLLERFIPLRERRVYEIGCDRQFTSATEMMAMGASSVVCTNVTQINTAPIDANPNISFLQIDAGRSPFRPEEFDVVYGRAILEHIHDPAAIVAEIQRVLKPGGMFYLDGGPMWTCRHGHHVWVNSPSGRGYIFPNHDTFEPWEHLMYPPPEIRKRLIDRGIPTSDADLIIEHVYNSDDQSRHAPTKIIDAFEAEDRLECLPVRVAVGGDPPRIPGYSDIDLRTGKLIMLGCKPAPGGQRGAYTKYLKAGLGLLPDRFIWASTGLRRWTRFTAALRQFP